MKVKSLEPTGSASGFEAVRRRGLRQMAVVALAAAILTFGIALATMGNGTTETDDLRLEADPNHPVTEAPETADSPEGSGSAHEPGSVQSATVGAVHADDIRVESTALADVESPPGKLVVAGRAGVAVMDLETGVVHSRSDEGPVGPGHQGLTIVDDVIVQATGHEVRLHSFDLEEPTVLQISGWRVLRAPDGTVWVGGDVFGADAGPRQRWTPIDPLDVSVGDPVETPAEAHVSGAIDDGLVIWFDKRVFVLDGTGAIHATRTGGALLDAGPGGLLWRLCDDDLGCELAITGPQEDPESRAEGSSALDDWQYDEQSPARLSPDGRSVVLWQQGPAGFRLGMLDVAAESLWILELDGLAGYPTASSDGVWVAALAEEPTVWSPAEDLAVSTPPLDIGQPAGVALR